eukprot:TRINITY_DN9104_c0_g1_i1.p1 TRINITY_DN9104_c0_g1~~TRINITY_DN9104_c0_g1_i1.p1  ORF type:complete len:4612 (+),score=1046.90 TRINITY_DN9104_c0_g1_i1:421-13836(+)
MSVTRTLPTATATSSASGTQTASESLPTLTDTSSFTPSETLEPTASATWTDSYTPTPSITLPAHDNFTTALEPGSFVEGQEVRVQLRTTFGGIRGAVVDHFNTSDLGSLRVRLLRWDVALAFECAGAGTAAAANILYDSAEFGISDVERFEGGEMVGSAHFTFTAPGSSTPFIICFKHDVPKLGYSVPESIRGKWLTFTVSSLDLAGAAQVVFRSTPSLTWYNLPEPTASQYAIVQLLSEEQWNFTYAPSSCGSSYDTYGMLPCGLGDSLKIVPAGTPCTYERQSVRADPYMGSNLVHTDGSWEAGAMDGLREGATAGGVGAFGTQYANPLVDTWASWGSYWPANELNQVTHLDTARLVRNNPDAPHHAYAYVRLPPQPGELFDVCYSSRQQRADWRVSNSSISALPMWRKLRRCLIGTHQPTSVCPHLGEGVTSFEVAVEPVGWTMLDLSPDSWGTIVFSDSGQGRLSSLPSTPPGLSSTSTSLPGLTQISSYWAPAGGDYFYLVDQSKLAEFSHRDRWGSFPSVGCWDRGLALRPAAGKHGGTAESGVAYPAGSYDLTGDPMIEGSDLDADAQTETFAPLWVPGLSTVWYVCYRRTCTSGNAACKAHSGPRPLPWHYSGRGAVPNRWLHLEGMYTPGGAMVPPPHPLVPTEFGVEFGVVYPPSIRWYMNDTRDGTYGPVTIEQSNHSEVGSLDSRAWDFVRVIGKWMGNESASGVVGSALRLVPWTSPCDFKATAATATPPVGAESVDGGMTECNSASAETDEQYCAGSTTDQPSVSSVTFYVTVPQEIAEGYRVCYRLRLWNWRDVGPAGSPADAWGTPRQPAGSLQRGDWHEPETRRLVVTAPATISMATVERRSGMEALFIVTDSRSELSTAGRSACPRGCSASGDVLRLVPEGGTCDVNPRNWNPVLADTRMSAFCPKPGAGTRERSGLFNATAHPVCANSEAVKPLCGGSACTPGARTTLLDAHLRTSPDIYDDLVPFDDVQYNHNAVAATVRLPPPDVVSSSRFTICYKQMATANWVVLNTTWEMLPVAPYSVSPAVEGSLGSRHLLSGELQLFAVLFDAEVAPPGSTFPGALVSFHAKLSRIDPTRDNNNCINPGGSTEASPLGAATSESARGATPFHLEFRLVVPDAAGMYMLCIMAQRSEDDSMSWLRPSAGGREHSYVVDNNGVRWWVQAGSQPTNWGVSQLRLQRCTPASVGTQCASQTSQSSFDTNPGGDRSKVVPADVHCSGLPDSQHAGREVVGSKVEGHTDLGPADGPSGTAQYFVTLPGGGPQDQRRSYKVCVLTNFASPAVGGPRKTWVEVQQSFGLSGQMYIADGFVSAPAVMRAWTLNEALHPRTSLFPGVATSSVGIAGASTSFIQSPTAADPPTGTSRGFAFHTYANSPAGVPGAASLFKFVASARTATRVPRTPSGAGWALEEIQGTSCFDPPAEQATNIASCGANCPSLSAAEGSSVFASLHLPLQPGYYLVCFKVHDPAEPDTPWLELPSAAGGGGLYLQPSYLEFEATSGGSNITVMDLRTVNGSSGSVTSLGSWCRGAGSAGTDCFAANSQEAGVTTGYPFDLLKVVTKGEVCSAPSVGPQGSANGPPEWFTLLAITNVTVMVLPTWTNSSVRFSLPPVAASSSGAQYVICVYKATQATADGSVVNHGVVYQLMNRGSAATGGGSGLWTDGTAAQGSQLTVTSSVVFNATVRFVEYTALAESVYQSAAVPAASVTDPSTGQVTRTPALRSGETVNYYVSVTAADGTPVPFGHYTVDVELCSGTAAGWEAVRCTSVYQPQGRRAGSTQASAAPFLVSVVGGACPASRAADYGWPRTGARQFMEAGSISYTIQYRSACPVPEYGCGLRFSTVAGGVTTRSAPMWISVLEHYPDALSLNGREVDTGRAGATMSDTGCTGEGPTCLLWSCTDGTECTLRVQARWQGPDEYAPRGTVSVLFSQSDYRHGDVAVPPTLSDSTGDFLSPSGIAEVRSQQWLQGGSLLFTATPRLRPDRDSGTAYLNITYGDGAWTRVAVRVSRLEPSSIMIAGVTALPAGTTDAAPSWVPGNTAPAATLEASPGSYLESLRPYAVRFLATATSGVTMSWEGALSGWRVSVSIEGGSGTNRILTVVTDSSGSPTANNFLTAPAYISADATSLLPRHSPSGWLVWFRVLNNDRCSRFNTPVSGCHIVFRFQRGAGSFAPKIASPVRVVALGVRVTTDSVGSVATATAREGIRVRISPGTVCGTGCWLADEFHYGDLFALVGGPYPSTGASNRDGVTLLPDATMSPSCAFTDTAGNCTVWGYSPRLLQGSQGGEWGAEWLLRPSTPCVQCEFTFHTSWGAGPIFHESGTASGVLGVTFTDEPFDMQCSPSSTVANYRSTEGRTDAFSVTVGAVRKQDPSTSAGYPRWHVFVDTVADVVVPSGTSSRIVSLTRRGSTAAVFTERMGEGAVAVFDELRFTVVGTPLGNASEVRRVTFRAAGPEYSATEPGAVPTASVSYSCTVDIDINSRSAVVSTPQIEVTGAQGADPLCTTGAGCTSWMTQTSQMVPGVRVDVMLRSQGQPVSTAHNVTVVPLGGSATSSLATVLDWSTADQERTTGAVTLDSEYNTANGTAFPDFEGNVFTFGQASVVFTRPLYDLQECLVECTQRESSVTSGVGWVRLAYSGSNVSEHSPVRSSAFQLCVERWDVNGSSGLHVPFVGPCVTVRLWIKPAAPQPPLEVTLISAPTSGERLPGGCTGKDGASLGFRVGAVYTPSSFASFQKYLVYDVPVLYSLQFPPTADGIRPKLVPAGTSVTNDTLTLPSRLPAGQSTEARTLFDGDPTVVFDVFVTEDAYTFASPASPQLSASNPDSPSSTFRFFTPSSSYWWRAPRSAFGSFELLPSVTYADGCPSKQALSATSDGYLTYQTTPGSGWGYAEASVGLPFPLQAIVREVTGRRAWHFARSLVRVSVESVYGCGAGGTLSVYELRPPVVAQAQRLLQGNLSDGWLGGAGAPPAAVATSGGVATPWVVLSEPCEACVLRVDLCYSHVTDPVSCLAFDAENPPTSPSDTALVLSARSALTLPINVRPPSPSQVRVTAQTVPDAGAAGTALVGQAFAITVEAVAHFGSPTHWALSLASQASVGVVSRWVPPDELDPQAMRYGNGGFVLVDTVVADVEPHSGCDVTAAEVAAAEQERPQVILPTGTANLNFFYTRPCSRCEAKVTYSVSAASGSFTLRTYTPGPPGEPPVIGAPVGLRVLTCAKGWALGGVPPSAVRRQRPFSLSVWRVDQHGFPAWEGSEVATLTRFRERTSNNGGGGEIECTSPMPAEAAGSVLGIAARAVNGVANIRVQFSRACWRCGVALGGRRHELTVLTTAEQFAIAPIGTEQAQRRYTVGARAEWRYSLWAADEIGDRSYGVGGPTPLIFQPRYLVQSYAPERVSLVAQTAQVLAVLPPPGVQVVSLTTGSPVAVVVNGSAMVNGVPNAQVEGEATDPGVVVVRMSGASGVHFPIRFTTRSTELPTRPYGSGGPLNVDFTADATDILLADPTKAAASEVPCVGAKHANHTCYVTLYAAAVDPSDSRSFTLSVAAVEGVPEAAHDCASAERCGEGAVVEVVSGGFADGVARLGVRAVHLPKASCTCTLSVAPPPGLGSGGGNASLSLPLSFSVSPPPGKWSWVSSESVAVASSTGRAAVGHPVALQLRGLESTGAESEAVVDWGADPALQITVSPSGCFSCQGGCAVELGNQGTLVTVRGVFSLVGRCSITAVEGFPVAAVESELRVDCAQPASFQLVVQQRGAQNVMVGGLTAATPAGAAAAVTDQGAVIEAEVLDAQGARVTGDQQTNFTITGTRAGVNWPTVWAVARQGLVRLVLTAAEPTRDAACTGGCDHVPWTYFVSATRPDGSSFGSTQTVASVYFVSAASALEASVHLGGGWLPAPQADGTAAPALSWMAGFPFRVRVAAVGAAGAVISHPDDAGSGEEIDVTPVTVPCLGPDEARTTINVPGRAAFQGPWLLTTCVTGGECSAASFEALPGCGAGEVAVNGSVKLVAGAWEGEMRFIGRRSGLQRLLLTPADADSPAAPLRVDITVQRPAGLRLYVDGQVHSDCITTGDAGLGPHTLCTLPSSAAAVDALAAVRLQVALVDEFGAVIVADNVSSAVATSDCPDASSWAGTLLDDGTVDVLSSVKARFTSGVAVFDPLAFTGGCPAASLIFRCSGVEADVMGLCAAARPLRVGYYNVTGSAPPGPPPPLPPPVVCKLTMAVVPFDTRVQELAALIGGLDAAEFGSRVLSALVQRGVQVIARVALNTVCAVTADEEAAGQSGECALYEAVPAGRRGHALQTTSDIRSQFTMYPGDGAAGADAQVVAGTALNALRDDLSSPTSVLRGSDPASPLGKLFKDAAASSLVGEALPATPQPTPPPGTPAPTPAPTPLPPTPWPLPTPNPGGTADPAPVDDTQQAPALATAPYGGSLLPPVDIGLDGAGRLAVSLVAAGAAAAAALLV